MSEKAIYGLFSAASSKPLQFPALSQSNINPGLLAHHTGQQSGLESNSPPSATSANSDNPSDSKACYWIWVSSFLHRVRQRHGCRSASSTIAIPGPTNHHKPKHPKTPKQTNRKPSNSHSLRKSQPQQTSPQPDTSKLTVTSGCRASKNRQISQDFHHFDEYKQVPSFHHRPRVEITASNQEST